MRTAPISQICASPAERPVVSRVEDDEARGVERQLPSGRRGERDQIPPPDEPRVGPDGLLEQRTRERYGCAREGEQRPRGLVRRHRAAALLDQLDESVGGVEAQLHT